MVIPLQISLNDVDALYVKETMIEGIELQK